MVTNDIFGKPFQLKFIRPAEMLLFANVACDPPLGQITVVPNGRPTVKFMVLLESSRSFREQTWEAVLWHDGHDDHEWRELPLHEVASPVVPLSIGSKSRAKVYRHYFSVDLPKPAHTVSPIHFTLKYRLTANDNWKWANQTLGLSDGELYFQPQDMPNTLSHYLGGFDSAITINSLPSESPGALLWSVTAPVGGAEGTESAYKHTDLGVPRDFTRWFALVRTWTPWLAPRHGRAPFSPQQGAVISSFLRWDGLNLVLLAISGVEDVLTELNPNGQGNVIATSRNDSVEKGTACILVAVATTFEAANAAVMHQARHVVAGDASVPASRSLEIQNLTDKDVKTEYMENWYDGLTYCTWNALGQDLTEDKIYNALAILKEKNINVTNLIIDDNWQTLDNNGATQFDMGWSEFEANPQGFPRGLKYTAMKIRKDHPNIKHIAVWHAILGYWGAVSPHGKIAKDYKTRAIEKTGGGTMTVVDKPDVDRMYDDFYKFLSDCGVDSVKTDAQFMLDNITDAPDRRRLITTYQDAWTIAGLRYFSIKAISCMSQFPQCLFHTQLPANKPRFMVRNSDDFFPDIPSSHPYHIFTNAHNALFTSHLNIIPDWDMFQTYHPYSAFHAAGRCVSGGPIYITDEPGKHNLDLIAQMTAQDIEGKTIVLRPSVFGKTTNVYTAYEEERLLNVGTFVGGKGGTSILALFNCSQRVLSEIVNLNAFPGIEPDTEYILRSHTTNEISPPLSLDDELPIINLEVDVKGYEILSAYPLSSFSPTSSITLELSNIKAAVLGLLGKMTGAAAVLKTDIRIEGSNRLKIEIRLKALGVLGIYIPSIEGKSVEDSFLVMIHQQVIPGHCVSIDKAERVLEIDIERAWKEMKLKPGYGNEVSVEVLMQ